MTEINLDLRPRDADDRYYDTSRELDIARMDLALIFGEVSSELKDARNELSRLGDIENRAKIIAKDGIDSWQDAKGAYKWVLDGDGRE